MHPTSALRIGPFVVLLAGSVALGGCSRKESGGEAAAVSMDATAASDVAAPKVTTKTSEWSVGGIVRGRTETVTREIVPAPPVVEEVPSPPDRTPPPQSGLLTAGDVDDLLNPRHYARYAGRFLQAQGHGLPFVDTRARVAIRVVDSAGRPVPFAKAELRRAGAPLRLVTTADGTASVYPALDKVPAQTVVTVRSALGDTTRTIGLNGTRSVTIQLPGASAPPHAMDLALVIDTTGSMGDEMAYLQAELDSIVARLRRNAGNLDLRIGVVLYRDQGDDYVVRTAPLSGDTAATRKLLAAQEADGGGDEPEAMDQALAAAQQLQWRPDAAKAVLLVTDAPPHPEKVAATIEAAGQLRSRGVQIVPVAASGVEDTAQYVLRTMAALTQGRYIFLTDDSGVGDSHAEPDVACYNVTRLNQLIGRVLAGIATGKRIEPRREDVIRTVGDYHQGRCATQQQS